MSNIARVRHRLDIGSSPAANIGDVQPMSNIHVNVGPSFRDVAAALVIANTACGEVAQFRLH
jgi:hypothetical protein